MDSDIRRFMEKLPVACTVCRLIYDEDRSSVQDVELVLANERFCEGVGKSKEQLVGRTFKEAIARDNPEWINVYEAVAVNRHRAEGVLYSNAVGHWIGYAANMAFEEYCCLTYVVLDEYREANERIRRQSLTNDCIVQITQVLNEGTSYEQIMNGVLEKISGVLTADRIYIFERTDMVRETFEWCAEGVEPMIDKLQPLDVRCFERGEKLMAGRPVSFYSPQTDEPLFDDDMMVNQGFLEKYVSNMLCVPLKVNDRIVGYLGADNYELGDKMDLEKILASVGTYIAARIANQQLLKRLDDIGKKDALTGIFNRLGFDSELRRYVEKAGDEPYVGVVIDIDNFKFLNDLLSHHAGDLALQAFAQSLVDTFGDRAVVGRNGGDEFVMLFKNASSADVAESLERFCVQEHFFMYEGEKYNFSISIGYAGCPEEADDFSTMLQRADTALYFGKRKGRHGCYRYTRQLEEQSRMRLGFALQDIVSNMPGAFLVHQAGADERILYANDALVSFFDCEDMDEFLDYTNCSFSGLVHPDDLKKLELKVWNQINVSDSNAYDYIDYRVITRTGRVKNVAASGNLVHNQFFGDVFYVLMLDRELNGGTGQA